MKRSVRPLFSILLLIVIAVTLCCRLLIHRRGGGGGFSSHELGTNAIAHPPASVFNPTLLKYAAIDIGEAEAKKEIEGLLDDGFSSEGRYKTFAAWRMWFNSHNTYTNGSSHRKTIGVLLRSPEFYRFWLEFRRLLQEWDRKRGFQADIMNELIQLVKIPIDRHNGMVDSNRRYNSCAVVGNSGILLQREYGKLIDEHEVVIRLNNAKTEKFDRNVGSKTHVSFVNSNILHFCSRSKGCFCHPYGPNVPMVMYICQPIHFMDYSICNSSHKEAAPLIVTDPRFDALCARIVKYYSLNRFVQETGKSLDEWSPVHDGPWFHYSSGFQAVMLAVGICEKVSIFGFGKSASAKHHYHTDQKAELRSHDYEAEYDVYDDLVTNPQAIPFVSDKFRFPPVVIYQ